MSDEMLPPPSPELLRMYVQMERQMIQALANREDAEIMRSIEEENEKRRERIKRGHLRVVR